MLRKEVYTRPFKLDPSDRLFLALHADELSEITVVLKVKLNERFDLEELKHEIEVVAENNNCILTELSIKNSCI